MAVRAMPSRFAPDSHSGKSPSEGLVDTYPAVVGCVLGGTVGEGGIILFKPCKREVAYE